MQKKFVRKQKKIQSKNSPEKVVRTAKSKVKGVFRGLRTLAVMPTFRCVANCTSCGTLSNPYEKTELSLESILKCIQEAKRYNFANIVYTGGEATLCWEKLVKAIKETKKRGMLTRLVTNAHWAATPDKALKTVESLKKVGLDEINFSTGTEHTKFIPIRNIMNAITASIANQLKPAIMIEDRAGRTVTKNKILRNPEIRRLILKDKNCLLVSESPWMPLNPFKVEQYTNSITANRDNLDSFPSCDTILQSLTLLSDGNISTCCGFGNRLIPELIVSDINKPDFLGTAIENTENDFMKIWLHYEGPIKILAWAAEKNPNIAWENMYAHCCQACLRIYKDPTVMQTIKENYQEKVSQVISSAWMEEVFIPMRFRKHALNKI
jgi:organic radical activating enzyme